MVDQPEGVMMRRGLNIWVRVISHSCRNRNSAHSATRSSGGAHRKPLICACKALEKGCVYGGGNHWYINNIHIRTSRACDG